MTRVTGAVVKTDFIADSSQFTAAVGKAQKATKSFGADIAATSRNLARIFVVTAAVGTAARGIDAVNQSTRRFTGAVGELSAITGATGKDLEFMKDKAFELGNQMGASAAEVLDGFRIVGSVRAELLGNSEALASVTEQVLILSKASGLDMVEASKVAVGALNQFKLEAEDTKRVVDLLAIASREGAAEVGDIGQALEYIGPVAKQAGLSLEQTLAMIEAMAEGGVRGGSKLGTGGRNFILRSATSDVKELNLAVVGADRAVENFKKQLKGLDEAGRTRFLKDFFGQVGISSAAAFLDNQEKYLQVLGASDQQGVASDQANKNLETYDGLVNRLNKSLENLGATLGDTDFAKGSVRAATLLVDKTTDALRDDRKEMFFGKGLGSSSIRATDQLGVMESSVPKISNALRDGQFTIENFTSAFKRLVDIAEQGSTVLESSIPSIGGMFAKKTGVIRNILNSGGQQETANLVAGIGGPNFNQSSLYGDFKEGYRKIVERIMKFDESNFNQSDPRLRKQMRQNELDAVYQSIDRLKQQMAVGKSLGFNTKTQENAMKNLRDMAKGELGQRREVVTLEIKMEDGLVVKHLKKTGSRAEVKRIIDERLEDSAQLVN